MREREREKCMQLINYNCCRTKKSEKENLFETKRNEKKSNEENEILKNTVCTLRGQYRKE